MDCLLQDFIWHGVLGGHGISEGVFELVISLVNKVVIVLCAVYGQLLWCSVERHGVLHLCKASKDHHVRFKKTELQVFDFFTGALEAAM